MSGRENVIINGIMLGLSRREMERRLDEIVRFAEIEEFIDAPVKTYSSGMYVRLGFSAALALEPDVLLVDEVLAVGDEAFSHKCLDRFRDLKRRGRTVLLVTHALGLAESLADEVLLIENGRLTAQGLPREVIDRYRDHVEARENEVVEKEPSGLEVGPAAGEERSHFEARSGAEAVAEAAPDAWRPRRWGDRKVEIRQVRLVGQDGAACRLVHTGDDVALEIELLPEEPLTDFDFGVAVFTRAGHLAYGISTQIEGFRPRRLAGAARVRLELPGLALLDGGYSVDIAVCRLDGSPYDHWHGALTFTVRTRLGELGTARLDHRWHFEGQVELDPPEAEARVDPVPEVAAGDDPRLALVDLGDFRLLVERGDSVIGATLLRQGVWEPFESELLRRLLAPGEVFVDVGANLGYYTLLASLLVGPQGKVVAFEPDPGNFALLERNARLGVENVVLMPSAVAGAQGTAALFRSPDNPGDHRLYDSGDGRAAVAVEATSLDAYFEGPGRDLVPTFIKLDIQGGEAAALAGMRRLIGRLRPRLLLELWPVGLRRAGHSPMALLDELAALDLVLYNLDQSNEEVARVESFSSLLERYPDTSEEFTNLLALLRQAAPAFERSQPVRIGPLRVSWLSGFHELERRPDLTWRWAAAEAALALHNNASGPRRVRLAFSYASGRAGEGTLVVDSPLLRQQLPICASSRDWEATLRVPPGTHRVEFHCDVEPVEAPRDPRQLVFRLERLSVGDLGPTD